MSKQNEETLGQKKWKQMGSGRCGGEAYVCESEGLDDICHHSEPRKAGRPGSRWTQLCQALQKPGRTAQQPGLLVGSQEGFL